MAYLTALLAFAVTMLILSTMVAAIVQFLSGLRRLRQRHLRQFVAVVFDDILWKRFQSLLAAPDGKTSTDVPQTDPKLRSALEALCDLFAGWLGDKPWYRSWLPWAAALLFVVLSLALIALGAGVAVALLLFLVLWLADRTVERIEKRVPAPGADERSLLREAFVRDMTEVARSTTTGADQAEKLQVTDFLAYLGRTEVGKAILEKGRVQARALVIDLARQFDSLGRGSTESYAAQARRWSILVAFALAFVVNVDAINLLKRFIDDPILAERVAALGDEAAAGQQAQFAALQKSIAETEAKMQEGTGDAEKAAARAALEQMKTDYAALQEKLQMQIESLEAAGLPIGWSLYPFCVGESGDGDPRCRDLAPYEEISQQLCGTQGAADFWASLSRNLCAAGAGLAWLRGRQGDNPGAFASWLVGTLLGGALIGLGCPFWFRVYGRLSALVQVARGLGLGKRAAKPAEGEAAKAEKPDPESAHDPADVFDAFVTAAEANRILSQGLKPG